jgi:hypothetical protein
MTCPGEKKLMQYTEGMRITHKLSTVFPNNLFPLDLKLTGPEQASEIYDILSQNNLLRRPNIYILHLSNKHQITGVSRFGSHSESLKILLTTFTAAAIIINLSEYKWAAAQIVSLQNLFIETADVRLLDVWNL